MFSVFQNILRDFRGKILKNLIDKHSIEYIYTAEKEEIKKESLSFAPITLCYYIVRDFRGKPLNNLMIKFL